MIRPEFWEDSKMAKLSPYARLFYVAMWNFADDEGYLPHDLQWLKAKCLPYDTIKVEKLLTELIELQRIEIKNGIICIKNFLKYQKINRPYPSPLKDQFSERSLNGNGTITEHSSTKIEVKEKLKEEEVKKNDSAEPQSVSTPPEAPPVMLFPVCGNGKEEWPLTQELVEQLRVAYPAVQIVEQCQKARAWCVTNPARRKTARGMPAFLNRWMAKEQDKGGTSIGKSQQGNARQGFKKGDNTAGTVDSSKYDRAGLPD